MDEDQKILATIKASEINTRVQSVVCQMNGMIANNEACKSMGNAPLYGAMDFERLSCEHTLLVDELKEMQTKIEHEQLRELVKSEQRAHELTGKEERRFDRYIRIIKESDVSDEWQSIRGIIEKKDRYTPPFFNDDIEAFERSLISLGYEIDTSSLPWNIRKAKHAKTWTALDVAIEFLSKHKNTVSSIASELSGICLRDPDQSTCPPNTDCNACRISFFEREAARRNGRIEK